MSNVQTKVVLITGCSAGGMGYEFCEEFHRHGCKVYATARSVAKMHGLSPEIERLALDVNSDESIRGAVETIIAREGRVDILVNNAGFSDYAALLDTPIDVFKSMFDTNTFSVLRMVQAVAPHMAERRSGLVLNVSSISAYAAAPFNGTYAATKAALNSMTDTLDMELRPLGIHVCLLCPGYVKTQLATNNAGTNLPPGSLYGDWRENIQNHTSGVESGMPVQAFAKQVVSGALGSPPTRYMSIGGSAGLVRALTWVPRSFRLWFVWYAFGTPIKTLGDKKKVA